MDYPELYKQLNQEIINADGKIGTDTKSFVEKFIASLPADKSQLDDATKQQLTDYLTAMQSVVSDGIVTATALALGEPISSRMQSKAVLQLVEQAFNERWEDGLTLSKRLWQHNKITSDGIEKVLSSGAKTGKSVSSIMYEMQRVIEGGVQTYGLNGSQTSGLNSRRFEIISRNRNQWTAQLVDAAKQLIHNPQAKKHWKTTVKEAERYIDKLATTGTRHASLQLLNEMKRAVDRSRLDLVDKSLNWWLYDKQLYSLKRIARTEMATATHRAVISDTVDNPSVIGYQWRLSSGHKITDICDYYASIEQGLGKGVWRKESVPNSKAHPHCMCLLIPRVTKIKEKGSENYPQFVQSLSDKQRAALLPQWANDALANNIPLKQLLREDGLGLVRKQDVIEKLVDVKAEKILAKLSEKANNATSLADVWSNPASYQKHIDKRIGRGHIKDEADYFDKVKETIKSAKTANFADIKNFPSMELVSGNWSVILDHDGLVKTAYAFEEKAESFFKQQTRLGHKVYEQQLKEGIRGQLKSLFDIR